MADLKETITRASIVYEEQTLFRAAINAIPYVGGTIDVLFSSIGQKFSAKRIEFFIDELKNEISHLQETTINKDYLEKEEGFDLILKAFNASARTRQKEKLILYARIIKNSLTNGREFEEDEPETFLKIVEELSVKELRVAMCLYKLKIKKDSNNKDKTSSDIDLLSKDYPEFDKDELVSILVRIEKSGLIKEVVSVIVGYAGGNYTITQLFKKFVVFIETFE